MLILENIKEYRNEKILILVGIQKGRIFRI